MSGGIYSFGRFRLDSTERRLFDGEQPVNWPKVFDTLRLLVENCGRVVSKKKMLDEVWEAPLSRRTTSPRTYRSCGVCSARTIPRNSSRPCLSLVTASFVRSRAAA